MKTKGITYKNPEDFNSLIELLDYFDTEQKCIEYFEFRRWGGTPSCPRCKHEKVYRFADSRRFKCAGCKKEFSVKIGTIFEGSNVPLRKWFVAIYLVTSHKKGISSYQLAKDIKVTQATGWFMLHRIRHKLGLRDTPEQLTGRVELDETFIGGKNKNRHANKKVKQSQGRSFKDKTPVMGMLQEQVYEIVERPNKNNPAKTVQEKVILQQSKVKCRVVPNTSAAVLKPIIKRNVEWGSVVISDEWCGYNGLHRIYEHKVIDHRAKQYVDAEGNTTNALEGFWSCVKRSYMGVYHDMSDKHLQRYMDEISFRYDTRSMKEGERVVAVLSMNNDNATLKYKQLIGRA